MLPNYVQLLLYISYEESDVYMFVTTKGLLVATTSAQVRTYYTKRSILTIDIIKVAVY